MKSNLCNAPPTDQSEFRCQIEQVRIESALLVVVIDLTVAQQHMSYSQVETSYGFGLAGGD